MRRSTFLCLALALVLAACIPPATPAVPVRETVLVVVTATPQPSALQTSPAGSAMPPVGPAGPTRAAPPGVSVGSPDDERGLYMSAGTDALDFVAQQQSQLKGCAERGDVSCACGIELTDQQALLEELDSRVPSDRFSAFHDDLAKVLTAWQSVRKATANVCRTHDAKDLSAAAEKLRAMDGDVSRALEDWDALRSEG